MVITSPCTPQLTKASRTRRIEDGFVPTPTPTSRKARAIAAMKRLAAQFGVCLTQPDQARGGGGGARGAGGGGGGHRGSTGSHPGSRITMRTHILEQQECEGVCSRGGYYKTARREEGKWG